MQLDYSKGLAARYHSLKDIKAILSGFPEELPRRELSGYVLQLSTGNAAKEKD
jgi:hypothetical protein